MKTRDITKVTMAAALLGAVSVATVASPAAAQDGAKVKCYGIAKAGENGCGNASGTHGCAGHSKVDYDGGEWKLATEATCTEMGGKTEPFEGVNESMSGDESQ